MISAALLSFLLPLAYHHQFQEQGYVVCMSAEKHEAEKQLKFLLLAGKNKVYLCKLNFKQIN